MSSPLTVDYAIEPDLVADAILRRLSVLCDSGVFVPADLDRLLSGIEHDEPGALCNPS